MSFPRIVSLGRKNTVKNKVANKSKTIIQTCDPSDQLQSLGIACNSFTIVSINDEDSFSSCN